MPRSPDPVRADASLAQAKKSGAMFKRMLRGDHPAHARDASVREADHKGHHIVIRTRYEVTIDGKPFRGELGVTNNGNVHYHAIPNLGFASAIDLVKCIIDVFPDEFGRGSKPPPGDHEGGHGAHAVRKPRKRG